MEVRPEFSRFVGSDDSGQPIIDTREAKTTLRVANRQTIVIGGLRQRDDIGEFSGIPYLMDMKYIGRLFRSRNTTVRESELIVFISPEIIDSAEDPNGRQKVAEDTLRCRLNQIPEAEGCPPCCRRLPPELILEESSDAPDPDPTGVEDASVESSPPLDYEELPPLAASQIPSAEFQFGVAGRAKHVQALIAEGRLRRLPGVALAEPQLPSQVAEGPPETDGLFEAPLVPQEGPIRTADGSSPTSVLR
jgi:hypothetical protein